MKLSRKSLAYVFLVASTVGVRGTYVIHEGLFERPVSKNAEMERAAKSIATQGTIGNIYSDSSGKSAHISPLYPLLLGGVYWFLDRDPVVRRFAQAVVAIVGTTIGITLLPKVASAAGFTTGVGWAAAFFLAVVPVNLWIESCGCWEQPFVAVVLELTLIGFCYLATNGWLNFKRIISTGLLLGLGALVNPSVLPSGGLMMVSELIRQKEARKQVWRGTVVMVFVASIVLAPWVLRNFYAFGAFIPFRSNFGLELLIGNNPAATGKTLPTTTDSSTLLLHPYSNPRDSSNC